MDKGEPQQVQLIVLGTKAGIMHILKCREVDNQIACISQQGLRIASRGFFRSSSLQQTKQLCPEIAVSRNVVLLMVLMDT